jgi:NTE family protein
MNADKVIAVDLSSDRLGRRLSANAQVESPDSAIGEWIRKLQEDLRGVLPEHPSGQYRPPSMPDVLLTSIEIMQDRISRSRMAGEPPDFIVSPRLAHFHLLDFHRAKEAIEEGQRAVAATLHSLRALVDQPS